MQDSLRIRNAAGTPVPIQNENVLLSNIMGLRGFPALRLVTRDKVVQHGAVVESPIYMQHKLVTLPVEFVGENQDDMNTWISSINAVLQDALLAPRELLFNDGSLQLKIMVQPYGDLKTQQGPLGYITKAQIQLIAPDVLCLSQVQHTQTSDTPVSDSYTVSCLNAGDTTANVVITLEGAGSATPIITNNTTGQSFTTQGLTMADSDVLVIDTLARTITLNGSESDQLIATASTQWWGISPGTSANIPNSISVNSNSCASLTVAWRDSYL